MMNKTILIIEDEEDIRDILAHYIKKEGYNVIEADNGNKGLSIMKKEKIDLLILDLMLPDISGFEVCKATSMRCKVPIIILTAKNDMIDKILGLELGADDYITKPFDIREVMARIKVCMRRMDSLNEESNQEIIELSNDIRINEKSREVFKGNIPLKFKRKEFELLLILAQNRKIVLTRDMLLEKVWGYDFEGESRTVDVHVQRLRKKLGEMDETSIIETVFGVGYKMT